MAGYVLLAADAGVEGEEWRGVEHCGGGDVIGS